MRIRSAHITSAFFRPLHLHYMRLHLDKAFVRHFVEQFTLLCAFFETAYFVTPNSMHAHSTVHSPFKGMYLLLLPFSKLYNLCSYPTNNLPTSIIFLCVKADSRSAQCIFSLLQTLINIIADAF